MLPSFAVGAVIVIGFLLTVMYLLAISLPLSVAVMR